MDLPPQQNIEYGSDLIRDQTSQLRVSNLSLFKESRGVKVKGHERINIKESRHPESLKFGKALLNGGMAWTLVL